MILIESGLRFRCQRRAPGGNTWRCVEQPAIEMLAGGRYHVDGVTVDRLSTALKVAREGLPPVPDEVPISSALGPSKYQEYLDREVVGKPPLPR